MQLLYRKKCQIQFWQILQTTYSRMLDHKNCTVSFLVILTSWMSCTLSKILRFFQSVFHEKKGKEKKLPRFNENSIHTQLATVLADDFWQQNFKLGFMDHH
jgi:hypothetical protein